MSKREVFVDVCLMTIGFFRDGAKDKDMDEISLVVRLATLL